MTPSSRRPLDRVLVERGCATDLDEARALVADGRVLVANAPAWSPARAVAPDEPVTVLSTPRFVGRGGEKLDGALRGFDVSVDGRTALDAGASTGGFTDCLLAHGATRVLAVDVGHDQLHERLSADPRVLSLERTNVRDLDARIVTEALGELASVVTVDLAFTSVTEHADTLVGLSSANATLLVLVKPQFEVDRVTASRGRGIVRDAARWREVLIRCASAFERAGAGIMGVMASPLHGASGNVEFFLHAVHGEPSRGAGPAAAIDAAIDRAGTP